MSESFEEVYDRIYPQLHNPCGLWKAATIMEWLDDLITAHDHELEQARDPQRIGGTLERGSFEYAIEQLREFRWQHATNDEDAIPYINNVARAHEHALKAEYHRGYEDGQHSMDAEHRAVAMRLRGLRFDGGSHENLNKIAYAIYPCATGWTVESCEGLRDRIIDLLGGVHDGVPDYVSCRACGDDRDSRDGQSEAVDADGAVSDVRADVPAADGVGDSSFTQVMYDELGNERHKAVRNLRQWIDTDGEFYPDIFFDQLFDMLGCEEMFGKDSGEQMCQRLIHLLGGDAYRSTTEYIERMVYDFNERGLKIKLNGVELSQASVDAMSRRAESDKKGDICETEPRNTVESSKCRENYKSGHIADELQAKLDEADAAIANYKEREKSFAESERLRDELQRTLREIAEHAGVPHDEDLNRYSDNLVAKATLAKIDSTREYVGALEWQRDRQKKLLDEHDQTRDELQAKLDTIREALDE